MMKEEKQIHRGLNDLKHMKTEWNVYINAIKNRRCSDVLKQRMRGQEKLSLLDFTAVLNSVEL